MASNRENNPYSKEVNSSRKNPYLVRQIFGDGDFIRVTNAVND